MKYCENCKKTYSDSVNFCTECGRALVHAPETNQHSVETNPPRKKSGKKRSIWRYILITIVILLVGFFALANYVINAATYLQVEPDTLIADKCGGETVVDIDYDGFVWTINHAPDWVEVEEFKQSFSVKVSSNLTGYNREGSITVQSGDFLAKVIIQQMGQATYIKASQTSLHFDADGGLETIGIDTDGCNYTVEYPDFLSVTTGDDNIEIGAYSNTDEYRSGYVTILEDNVRVNIYVTQGGACNVCHGSGSVSCYQCGGQGGWGYGIYYSQCWLCNGTGTLQCSSCHGTGERE